MGLPVFVHTGGASEMIANYIALRRRIYFQKAMKYWRYHLANVDKTRWHLWRTEGITEEQFLYPDLDQSKNLIDCYLFLGLPHRIAPKYIHNFLNTPDNRGRRREQWWWKHCGLWIW